MKKILVTLLTIAVLFIVLPASASAATKKIVINLTHQRLQAFEDEQILYDFPVSTGKLRTPTPTGGFWPWIKLRKTRMRGGSALYYNQYDLPNVPYVVYFYNENYPKSRGYGLHGTYWHNNFGHPMSHGCVNLRTSDMQKLYPWIDLPDPNTPGSGTLILIEGHTPTN